MNFVELVLHNFGAFKGRQSINLQTTAARPVIIFGGQNGAGKTTIFDAIKLCLYGHRARCSNRGRMAYSAFLKECINRQVAINEKTRIELEIEVVRLISEPNGKKEKLENKLQKIRIVRSWDSSVKDKDTLGILVDDWPSEGLAQSWDETIESLFPVGMSDLFLFDGEKIREMAELDAPPESLVEAIKSLFGLHLADQLETDLKVIEKRRAKKLKESGADEVVLDQINDRLINHRTNKSQLLSQKEEAQLQLEQAEKKSTFTKNQFIAQGASLTERQSELEKALVQCNAEINSRKAQLIDLVGGELPFALILPLLEETLAQGKLEHQNNVNAILAEHFEPFTEELSLLIGNLKLPAAKSEKLYQFLDENLEALKQPTGDRWLEADGKDVLELEHLLSEAREAQTSKDKLLQELATMKEHRNDIEIQLAGAAVPEQYERLKQELQTAEDAVVQAKVQVGVLIAEIDREQRQIDQCIKEVEAYAEAHIELQNSRHIIGSASKARQTIEKYRDALLNKRTVELEQELTLCSRFLLHKNELIHRVQVSKRDFSISIFDTNGNLIPKHRLSAGEQQLLITSYLWALAKLSKLKLPVCIDTPLGRLDKDHRESVITKYFPHASHQVLVFSTNTELNEESINLLRDLKVIQREYLLQNQKNTSQLYAGYFW